MSRRAPFRNALALLIPLAFAGVVSAQHGLSAATTYEVLAESGVPEIPFRLYNDHVLLEMRVAGSDPLTIVLDTGMPMGGLALHGNDRTEALDLDFSPIQAAVGGAGGHGKRMTARVAMGETVETEGLRMEDMAVIVMERIPGFAVYHDGIIGHALFRRFAVELDHRAGVLRLHDPDTWQPPAGAHVVPMTLRGNMPFVNVGITYPGGEEFRTEVVVDLGASHAISLNTEESDRIHVPDGAIESVLGHGLSGAIEGHIGRIAALDIGGARLENVITSFPVADHQNPRGMDSLGGNLGNGALSRFDTTFDYAHQRLVLVERTDGQEPFEFDMSGLQFAFGADELTVDGLVPRSPAARAGIRVGDVVTHVDGKPVDATDRFELRERMQEPGRKIRLAIRRDGKTLKKVLELKRLV